MHSFKPKKLPDVEGSFILSDFNKFINEYKATHFLASEAEKAFDVLIDSLNQYFDVIENITEDDVNTTLINTGRNHFFRP